MHPAIAEGIRLFNSRRFFEAHEALETLWLKEQGEEKLFLHGLIQVAAAFHHLQRNNPEGFRRVLAKGMSKLMHFSGTRGGIDVDSLRREIRRCRRAHLSTPSTQLFPEIQISAGPQD
jgi:hypothetical protein